MKHKSSISIIFLLLLSFSNTSYSQQNINGWYWMNGQPQSEHLNWVQYINPTTIYATGDYGNFMKSTDGGNTWLLNSQSGPFDNSVISGGGTRNNVTGHFFDANTGLVGGFSQIGDAIGRTTDGGQTFTRITLGPGSQYVFGFYFLNSTTGYACGNVNTGLYKTTDAGLTWSFAGIPLVVTDTYYCLYAFDENRIMVSGTGRKYLYTTNGGNTWTTIFFPGSTFNTISDIDFKDANTGYVCGSAYYFAYTTDAGTTWTQTNAPVGAGGQWALSISGNDVYIAGDNGSKIFKSSDNGVSWTPVDMNDGSPYQPAPAIMYGMDINGSNIAVVGLYGIVNVSTDGGATWDNKNNCVSQTALTFSAIWAESPTGNIFTAGTAGTLLHSSNGGVNWTQRPSNSPQQTNNIQMLNPSTGFAVSGNAGGIGSGYLNKTTDGGLNWTNIPLPFPYSSRNAVDIDFLDEITGWIVGGKPNSTGGGIVCIKTTDGGSTWVSQSNDQNYNFMLNDIDMVDQNTGYIVPSTTTSVFKTTNGGNNWIRLVTTPGVGSFNKVQVISGDVIYISGVVGQLFKSTNGGISWTNIPTPYPGITLQAMQWMDEKNGMIGGTNGFIGKTTNGGLTWESYNTGGSNLKNVFMTNRDSVFAVSDFNGYWQIFRRFSHTPAPLSMIIKVGIQGFWNGTTQVSDTISVTLRSQNSPYNIIDQSKTVIYSQGSGTVSFSNASSGHFFIQINHRNSLETWSSVPVNLSSNLNQYDFTTASSKAYGNNTILESGRYCDYSGDVNQEGNIDLADLVAVYNSSSVFTTGYAAADVNGDNFVDLSDLVITKNNASNFIVKITP